MAKLHFPVHAIDSHVDSLSVKFESNSIYQSAVSSSCSSFCLVFCFPPNPLSLATCLSSFTDRPLSLARASSSPPALAAEFDWAWDLKVDVACMFLLLVGLLLPIALGGASEPNALKP